MGKGISTGMGIPMEGQRLAALAVAVPGEWVENPRPRGNDDVTLQSKQPSVSIFIIILRKAPLGMHNPPLIRSRLQALPMDGKLAT